MFMTDKAKSLSFYQYEALMNEEGVCDKIASILMERYEYLKNQSVKEVAAYVKKSDKDLFIKLRDGHYTLDQLKARIAERTTGLKYVVLDDLKDQLDPRFYEEVYNPKEKKGDKASESKRGRHSAAFLAVSRERGEKRRNYQCVPESLGTVDFDPTETSERVKPHKRKNLAANPFKVVRPKSPVDLDKVEMKVDPQKLKKQANIERLKQQLALRLWEEKLLEI